MLPGSRTRIHLRGEHGTHVQLPAGSGSDKLAAVDLTNELKCQFMILHVYTSILYMCVMPNRTQHPSTFGRELGQTPHDGCQKLKLSDSIGFSCLIELI